MITDPQLQCAAHVTANPLRSSSMPQQDACATFASAGCETPFAVRISFNRAENSADKTSIPLTTKLTT